MPSKKGCLWGSIIGLPIFIILSGAIFIPALLTTRCVLEGELVDIPAGRTPIEALQVGDAVLTRGPSGAIEAGRVVERRESTSRAWRELVLEGGAVLRVTATHPVAVEDGWKTAGVLDVGDLLSTRDGLRPIAEIRERSGMARVFDLTVEPNPNFFASGVLVHNKSGWERTATSTLKHLAAAQGDFRANDRDNNKYNDFWVKDIAGLYVMVPAEGKESIKLIELSCVAADDAPCGETAVARDRVCTTMPKAGYLYRALLMWEDEAGQKHAYDEGHGRNLSKFGFVAFPVGEGMKRAPTLIINECHTVFTKRLEGARVDTFPSDENLKKDGWAKFD